MIFKAKWTLEKYQQMLFEKVMLNLQFILSYEMLLIIFGENQILVFLL